MRSRLSCLSALLSLFVLVSACSGSDSGTTSSGLEAAATTIAPVGCSAEELGSETEARDNLTPEAEATRLALIEAALECDFDTLADLANAGTEPFESDGGDDLVAAWVEQEAAGEEPMRILVTLLRGTMGTVALDTIEYRFPSAAGFSDWAEVPEGIRESLQPLYSEDDLAAFEAAGVYNGHRTAISDSGEWLSFLVAGS
jgi:hypothetical protein